MKYIIMKAQEAREFETHGIITIEKPFKSVPPYIEGASMERTGRGEWQLMDETGRPIEGEDGIEWVYVPPVWSGDIVYIREPWLRLKNPDGNPLDRIRLVADSVVSEGQQACKWSSPVSMPEDAIAKAESEPPADSAKPLDDADNTGDTEELPEEITKGLCKYCGQVVEVGPCTSQPETDEAAALVCKCAKASATRRMREQDRGHAGAREPSFR